MKIDPEVEVRGLLRSTGRDDDAPPIALELAADLLGDGAPVYVVPATEVWGDGEVEEIAPGRWRIFVRENLSPEQFLFTVYHEIAEWHVHRLRLRFDHFLEKERVCDAIAAALVAPQRAFRAALRDHGEDFAELAEDFLATETCMALRLGEVEHVPVCVLSEGGVRRVRGPAWTWPQDPTTASGPGLRRARLRDRGERLALIVG